MYMGVGMRPDPTVAPVSAEAIMGSQVSKLAVRMATKTLTSRSWRFCLSFSIFSACSYPDAVSMFLKDLWKIMLVHRIQMYNMTKRIVIGIEASTTTNST